VTHGFPKHRAPLFRSTNFHIENRPGLEDQSTEGVIKELAKLNAPEIAGENGGDNSKKHVLADWISDWHLVAFLATTQLFSPEDTKTLIEVASSPNLLDDPSILDKLLHTDGWQTLMTFTKEMGCKCPRLHID
jgi:nuclear protein localization protein 4 homolog